MDGSVLGSLPGNAGGLTTEDLSVRFLIGAESSGHYNLVFAPADYWTDGGPAQDTWTFTLS